MSTIGRSKIPQTLHKALAGTPRLGTTLKFQLPTTNFFPFWESYFLMLGDSKTRYGALALPFPFKANIDNVRPTHAFDMVLYCSRMVVMTPGLPTFQQVFRLAIPNDRRLLGTKF